MRYKSTIEYNPEKETFKIDCEQQIRKITEKTIRDTKAESGGVTEADWARIDELLHQSWRSLSQAVKSS